MNAWRGLTILFFLAFATTARAADNRALARASFASGTSHYDLAEYRQALVDFKEAYRNIPDPTFLFNIAQCHRQLGENDDAIRFYRTYLSKVPQAANQREVRAMIVKLEKLSAEQHAAAPPPTTPPVVAPVETPPPVVTPPPPVVTAVPAVAVVAAPPPPPRTTPLYKRWWLWTAVGGAVAIGLGVGLGVGLSHDNATATTSFGTVHPF
ncbi:MAG TPA: hypothetical protein VIA18_33220 [Polyangia bacterium]|nr:hypothetical protein [Polyangia bacterium]